MKNLPPAWQSIVESLNKTLRSLGENELTRDEFAFLVSKFNEVPQTVKEGFFFSTLLNFLFLTFNYKN